jgi:hypothetical protein
MPDLSFCIAESLRYSSIGCKLGSLEFWTLVIKNRYINHYLPNKQISDMKTTELSILNYAITKASNFKPVNYNGTITHKKCTASTNNNFFSLSAI